MENVREAKMWSEDPERLEDLSRTPSRLIRTHTVRLHVPDPTKGVRTTCSKGTRRYLTASG